MDFGICVDDNSHFTPREAKELDIGVVPLPIFIGDKTYFEYKDLDSASYYKRMVKEIVKTSMASPKDTMDVWDKIIEKHGHVLYIPTSRALSANIEMASTLAQDEKYKGKVTIVDNHRMSVVLKCSVFDALVLKKEGKNPDEIKEYLEKEATSAKLYIALNTLKYLARGGRLTPAAAKLGNFINIKPVLSLSSGKLDAKAKALGMPWAKKMMLNFVKTDLENEPFLRDKSRLIFSIAYTDDLNQAKEWAKMVSKFFGLNKEQIMIDPLSLSTGAHIGPGALALTVTRMINSSIIKEISQHYSEDVL